MYGGSASEGAVLYYYVDLVSTPISFWDLRNMIAKKVHDGISAGHLERHLVGELIVAGCENCCPGGGSCSDLLCVVPGRRLVDDSRIVAKISSASHSFGVFPGRLRHANFLVSLFGCRPLSKDTQMILLLK